jgi:hypothetical protein
MNLMRPSAFQEEMAYGVREVRNGILVRKDLPYQERTECNDRKGRHTREGREERDTGIISY